MNTKPILKVKHKVERLISFIEKNEIENVKKIIDCEKNVLKKREMDENEPIYYAVKYKCNKIFDYILKHSDDVKYNVSKICNFIFFQN